jgi:hypothetical protein
MMLFGFLSAMGAVAMFLSWIVGHGVWLDFAENVSAAPGIAAGRLGEFGVGEE